ncbi:MAG TPA: helix-turn-helix domain-containing protein, partial [Deltaproteobacteria bacterium]|nr:helix-turn-helix domain-containing protein [Deltaproteobacteria bacterium]
MRGTDERLPQLTHEERHQIAALLKAGHPQSGIATVLKRHKSTISREFSGQAPW